ncbi:hypothetical protein skT53_32090 [Effusibacillus dendaii]|uniref:Uncharacterized protein n=1 Tax=Effusibacillus dendaii TaxID=2743772 RepID=A0A7I8DDM5_9BACL|nr:hypothetical protein skT53_32090 [Effusibacillus dendaii]
MNKTDDGTTPDTPSLDKVDLQKVPKLELKDYPKPPKPASGSSLPLNQSVENILIAPEYYF